MSVNLVRKPKPEPIDVPVIEPSVDESQEDLVLGEYLSLMPLQSIQSNLDRASAEFYRCLETLESKFDAITTLIEQLPETQTTSPQPSDPLELAHEMLVQYLTPQYVQGGRGIIGLPGVLEFPLYETANEALTSLVDHPIGATYNPAVQLNTLYLASPNQPNVIYLISCSAEHATTSFRRLDTNDFDVEVITTLEPIKEINAILASLLPNDMPAFDLNQAQAKSGTKSRIQASLQEATTIQKAIWTFWMSHHATTRHYLCEAQGMFNEATNAPVKEDRALAPVSTGVARVRSLTNRIIAKHIGAGAAGSTDNAWIDPQMNMGGEPVAFNGANAIQDPDMFIHNEAGVVFGSSSVLPTGEPYCNQVTFRLDNGHLVVLDKLNTHPEPYVFKEVEGQFKRVIGAIDVVMALESLDEALDSARAELGH